jgi:hypothetical protein
MRGDWAGQTRSRGNARGKDAEGRGESSW